MISLGISSVDVKSARYHKVYILIISLIIYKIKQY